MLRCADVHLPSWQHSQRASQTSRNPLDRAHCYPLVGGSGPWHRRSSSYARAPCACCRKDRGTSRGSRTSASSGRLRLRRLPLQPTPSANGSLLLERRMPFLHSQQASEGVIRLPAEAVDRARARLAGCWKQAFVPRPATRRPRFEACPETALPPHLCGGSECGQQCLRTGSSMYRSGMME